jgi:4a-hydroxytetrahydrobiopterin dehydratase
MKFSDQIESGLAKLPDWQVDGDAITREFKFADFKAAFAFMTAVAKVADELNHHPDWRNVYNRVEVRLSTHDVGGLSELDFELAQRMDLLAAELT